MNRGTEQFQWLCAQLQWWATVDAAMSRLHGRRRETVELYLSGLSAAQIAKRLSETGRKTTVAMARAELERALDQLYDSLYPPREGPELDRRHQTPHN